MAVHYCPYLLAIGILAGMLHFSSGGTNLTTIDDCLQESDEKLDCSGRKFTSIPSWDLTGGIVSWDYLDLSHNDIVAIENGTFEIMKHLRVIDLSYNKISNMELGCFSGLYNLQLLDISHNKLSMHSSFMPGIFRPLQSLEVLRMQGALNGVSYPDEALQDLTNLKELYMQGTNKAFGSGFTSLTNLRLLHLSPPNCKVDSILNDTLMNLRFSQLRELTFQQCYITNIADGAFMYFPQLNTLNVVCNYNLGIKMVLKAIANIPGKPVETLVLDDIERADANYRYFTKDTVCINDFSNLKRLSLRNNAIDSLSMDVLSCMPSLEVINIGFNALTLTWAPWHIFRSDTRQYWLNSNITELDMSYAFSTLQYTFKPRYCPEHLKPTREYFRNFQIPKDYVIEEIAADNSIPSILDRFLDINFNPKLQALHIDHIHFSFFHDQNVLGLESGLFSSSSLCRINLPKNDIRFVNASYNLYGDFNCHVTGLDHLQVLDLSYSNIKTINSGTLKSSPNLRTLFLAGNDLGMNYSQLETALDFVPQLESISIADNKIKQLSMKTFLKAKAIKNIDISKNSISVFNIELGDLLNLEKLDLSSNLMPSLQQPFLQELKDRVSLNKTLTIDLLGNPLQCDCAAIEFLKFVRTTAQYNIVFKNIKHYYCPYNGVEVHLAEVDIANLEESCKESNYYTIIIAVLVTIIVLLIILALVIYRYRWRIAWKVYEARRIVRQVRRQKSFKLPVHKYKVFVAYATLDDVGLPWMRYELLPRVEDQWDMKAFILDRDSLVGPFLEEVTNGIKHSEKKLFTVTKDFLRLYHWPMVLHWCVDSGLSLLIMVLIDMKVQNLPPSLAKVTMALEKRYPTHVLYYKTGGDNRDVWSNLKIALDEPKRKSTRVSVL